MVSHSHPTLYILINYEFKSDLIYNINTVTAWWKGGENVKSQCVEEVYMQLIYIQLRVKSEN